MLPFSSFAVLFVKFSPLIACENLPGRFGPYMNSPDFPSLPLVACWKPVDASTISPLYGSLPLLARFLSVFLGPMCTA